MCVPVGPGPSVHPLWFRTVHWINVLATGLLMVSGWRIFNASPLFAFAFPKSVTLGGWHGGALQWHFAAMWLFAANGVLYVLLNLLSGRWFRSLCPITPNGVLLDGWAALRGRLTHTRLGQYNQVRKLAYVAVVLDAVMLTLSGLVLWKSVQFPLLRDLLGGYEAARWVHFSAMTFMAVFIAVHLLMVALVPRTLVTMLRGR